MQVLGFYGDDDYVDEPDDYEVEEQRTATKRPKATTQIGRATGSGRAVENYIFRAFFY